MTVLDVLLPRLVALPGVLAVALGGSRARGTHRPDSDWDLGVYYRGGFDARALGRLGFAGHVAQPGEWGRIVNGGAWLSVEGEPVDVLLRDLDVVDAWRADADHGRFQIDQVEGHLAGLPTYTPLGEIAVNRVLAGRLPAVAYPAALRETAQERWRWNAAFSLTIAEQHVRRGDRTLALGMMARATAQAAHAVMAGRGAWVLGEKGLVDDAGLGAAHDVLGDDRPDPAEALHELRALLDAPRPQELRSHRTRARTVRLRPADAGEVLTLQRAAYVPEARAHGDIDLPPLTEHLAEIREQLADGSVTAWGVRDDGRLVAAVRITRSGSTAVVSRLVVAPDRQGEGLGSGVLRHAEEQLDDGVSVIELFTGEHSVTNLRLYDRLGFRETHRTDAGTYALVHMAKPRGTGRGRSPG